MGLPRTTVQSVLESKVEAPQKQVGRKRAITDKVRRRLVARATLDAAHRRMKYEDIALQLEVSLTSVKRYMAQAFEQCILLVL